MQIETEALQTAFKLLDKIPNSPGLLSSQFVKMEVGDKLTLNLTGLVISSVKVPVMERAGEGIYTFYADRRVLGGFIASVTGKTITLKHQPKPELLTLKSGRHQVELAPAGEISGYQTWKQDNPKTLVLDDAHQKQLQLIAQYAPDLAALDHLSAVRFVKGLGMVATDSVALAASFDAKQAELTLPAGLAKLYGAVTGAKLVVDKNGVGMVSPIGYLYQSKLAKPYPMDAIHSVLKGNPKSMLKIPIKVFSAAISYLDQFSVYGAGVDAQIAATADTRGLVLQLKLPSGVVEQRIPLENLPSTIKEQWSLGALAPWAKFFLDSDKTLDYGKTAEGFQYFKIGKSELLALAPHD